MNCSEAQELLSAYYDGELPADRRVRLSEHVDECSVCAQELAAFEGISNMVSGLAMPEPPEHIWAQLESQLVQQSVNERPVAAAVGQLRRSSSRTAKLFSLAATALVAIGMGWFAYQTWFAHGEHHRFASEFGDYLDEFHRDPDAAQQILLVKYENQLVDPDKAIERVGYRPAVADGLPEGYSIESTYVMKMPCCTCVQSLCQRADGSTIVIFEHDDEETTEWFGDRPKTSTRCNGERCSLVQLDDRLAASWKRDKRHMTVVGIRDIAELTQLVSWFDKRKQITLQ